MPYLTGDDPGANVICYQITVPDDPNFLAAFNGALLELTRPENWEAFGTSSVDDSIDLASTMFDSITEVSC